MTTASSSSSALARRWRLAGWALLALAGVAACAYLFVMAPDSPSPATGYSIAGGQAFADPAGPSGWQAQQIARVGSHGTLLLARLDDWLGTLWHGRRLALTLGVLAVLGALACRFVAGLVDEGDFG